jgi:ribosome-binding ATPase YchF (GTP1/OBG family)
MMSKISMDLTKNENQPLIREMIMYEQLLPRFLNDVSNGAMLIKDEHRLKMEYKMAKYTLNKMQLHELITTTIEKIVVLHQLTMSFNIDIDCIRHIQSYLFQNGVKTRMKLKRLHDKNYRIFINSETVLYQKLIKRHRKFGVRIKFLTLNNCYFYYRNNEFYKNNNPDSNVLISDMSWLTNRNNFPYFHDSMVSLPVQFL